MLKFVLNNTASHMSADPIKIHFKFQITKNVMLVLLAISKCCIISIITYNQGQGPSYSMKVGFEDKMAACN